MVPQYFDVLIDLPDYEQWVYAVPFSDISFETMTYQGNYILEMVETHDNAF